MLRTCSAKVQNDAMFDWNDARFFLSVAESGSTLAAGRALRVSQTTVARRIAALEESLGLTLFDKRRTGYALTAAGEALLIDARALQASAEALAAGAAARKRQTGGAVRLTCEESYAVGVLTPMLRELHELRPDIMIELDATDEIRDLEAGAADVAIRVAKTMSGAGLVGRKITDDYWTVYCSRAYAEAHGIPRNRRQLAAHPLIGGGGGRVGRFYAAWLKDNGLEQSVAMTHGSVTGLIAAVRSGVGCAALPCLVAEMEDEFVHCLPTTTNGGMEVWLLTHERLRHSAPVRAVIDFLYARLKQHARMVEERLAGIATSSPGHDRQAEATFSGPQLPPS
jgi:DNA-binding transcriptional LysR family regulator